MSGGAIPASKYTSSTLIGFRHPVTALYALFSSVFSFGAWGDLAQTYNRVYTHTYRAMLCARDGMGSRTDFSHISEMFEDTKMISGLDPFFHIALLNDFDNFALCMSDRLFESTHCSTDSPSLFVVVYAQSVRRLLKSPITMWSLFLCPNAGSRNGSGDGLYMECTTTSGSSTVMRSTFPSSQTNMLFTFSPCLIKTKLPCLLCGRSATSAIPGIIGLVWYLDRCVSWRQRQWQCCSLHTTDSMDTFLAVRPSTFADITVIATEGLWLWTADMVCSLMLWKN